MPGERWNRRFPAIRCHRDEWRGLPPQQSFLSPVAAVPVGWSSDLRRRGDCGRVYFLALPWPTLPTTCSRWCRNPDFSFLFFPLAREL